MRRLFGVLMAVAALLVSGCGDRTNDGSSSGSAPPAQTTANPFSSSANQEDPYAYDSSAVASDFSQDEQDEWSYQEGDYWQEFSDGYDSGWETGCDDAF